MIIRAPAKVNLFLEVLGKRPDGFHEIETVMMATPLFDELRVLPCERDEIRLTGQFDLPSNYVHNDAAHTSHNGFWGEKNLIFRAAQQLKNRVGFKQGCEIHTIKRIPSEAGLGGASSDAAATLIALNSVWSLGLKKKELVEIAAELGSDVPFFLQNEIATCLGRGEKIAAINASLSIPLVICKPPVGLSTAKVYAGCRVSEEPISSKMIQIALNCANVRTIGKDLHNALELPATEICTEIEEITFRFSQSGSLGYQLSGSGTSVFGIFSNLRAAQRVAKRFRQQLPNCFVFVGNALAPRRY